MSVKYFLYIFLGFFLALECFGYSFTQDFNRGIYWASFPIKMKKFVVDPSDGPLLESLVRECENEWEDAAGMEIWDIEDGFIVDSNVSGNYIRWSNNFAADTGYDPNSTLGVTIRYRVGTHFERTVIILNGELDYLRQNYMSILKKTILHEMGHTFGLDHSDQHAIMQAYLGSVKTLQDDDIRGVNAVIDETLRRQEVGYVSPISGDSWSIEKGEKTFGSCGSVAFAGDDSSGSSSGGNGVVSFLFSVLVGLFLSGILKNSLNKLNILVN
jgi:hypothetical protein